MSRINTPSVASATGTAAEVFAEIKKAAGKVPNAFAAIGALNPEALKAFLAVDAVLTAGSLSAQDRETVKLVVSEVAGCDYCVAAHSLLGEMTGLKPETLKQLREGQPTGDAKRDALVAFVRTLQQTGGTISDEAYAAIRAAGYSEAQLVDITLAVTTTVFTNVFNRINDTTLDFPKVA